MKNGQVARTAQDLIGRFTPTPLCVEVHAIERTIRVETNSPSILELMRRALQDCGEGTQGSTSSAPPAFRWRLVSDPLAGLKPPWPEASGVSDEGLRYASFGQSGFVAVDLASREAVGFLAEELMRDDVGFKGTVLGTLFSMTADALGLTAFRALTAMQSAVGLLIFGLRPNDKATLSHLAEEVRLEFPAGETTFLDLTPDGFQAWGGFWPDRAVAPACCVFFERASPEGAMLVPLSSARITERLRPYLLFDDDRNFGTQHADVLRALARLPAYCLAYGSGSTGAAGLFRRLLEGQPARKVSV
jgi:hypothetical protein